MSVAPSFLAPFEAATAPLDVCIVVEGCYPFVAGGVSGWLDWLIRSQPETEFGVVALTADARPREPRYDLPSNVAYFATLPLAPPLERPGASQPLLDRGALAALTYDVTRTGSLKAFEALCKMIKMPVRRTGMGRLARPRPPDLAELTSSRAAWDVLVECYGRIVPQASFGDFFWAWRTLVGGLLSVASAPVPQARAFHAISTGYAGLYAVRAARACGVGAAITEHGIYTNERRIDLVTADWIEDRIETGLAGDGRTDMRRFWIETFDAYARIAYAGADRITTLYGENQSFQRALGAAEEKLEVIANGIALERFDALEPEKSGRPTVALIGRVVPIKDIEAFITAAADVRKAIPDVEVLVIGPTDEDPDYYALCRRRAAELGLEDTVNFTGKVDIADYLPRIDIIVLTSISEAQPLVLLEAGAARIPCVATDVGSCREIIEGATDEEPNLGRGGRVVPPMDGPAIGAAIVELLSDPALAARCGAILRRRVETAFTSDMSAARYAALYKRLWER